MVVVRVISRVRVMGIVRVWVRLMVREKVKDTDIGMIMFGERDGGVYLEAARYGKVCEVIKKKLIIPRFFTPHYHSLLTVVIAIRPSSSLT